MQWYLASKFANVLFSLRAIGWQRLPLAGHSPTPQAHQSCNLQTSIGTSFQQEHFDVQFMKHCCSNFVNTEL